MTQTDKEFIESTRTAMDVPGNICSRLDALRLLSIIDAQTKRIEELEDGLKKIEHHTDDDTAAGIAYALSEAKPK